MLKIRLTRTGAKNDPKYRIVVTPARSKRDGKFLEILGYYLPKEGKNNFKINFDRYNFWQKLGAKPSETVAKLTQNLKNAKS